ncbi:STAS/SEC14 domain-containing protein [Sagittula sp. S175]|uniref:STAS/SEC14 domain-containing protein n=1 Tax=Sagittula sp. S175 TaxID=3415129 RepID=UPI003C7D83FB
MPLFYSEDDTDGVVELTIRGMLSRADYAAVLPHMAALMARHDRVGVVEVVESFAGFEDGDIELGVDPAALKGVGRVALVSDIGWFCPILSKAPGMAGIQVRSYRLEDLDAARAWVREGVAARA